MAVMTDWWLVASSIYRYGSEAENLFHCCVEAADTCVKTDKTNSIQYNLHILFIHILIQPLQLYCGEKKQYRFCFDCVQWHHSLSTKTWILSLAHGVSVRWVVWHVRDQWFTGIQGYQGCFWELVGIDWCWRYLLYLLYRNVKCGTTDFILGLLLWITGTCIMMDRLCDRIFSVFRDSFT